MERKRHRRGVLASFVGNKYPRGRLQRKYLNCREQVTCEAVDSRQSSVGTRHSALVLVV